ncbi:MAG TPA: hypothetical protein VFW48_02290 [Solirubrobacterales bacterium]|nr:hypothetical protein [Solirubrobacterales bacterium]
MTEQARDSGARPKYLNDANYYRLGYQLAAQEMNVECTLKPRRDSDVPRAVDVLYGEFSRAEASTAGRGRARDTASRFLADAEATLAWYDEREKTKWWWPFPDKLTVPERRLRRFLQRTVIPCLQLVIAASLRDREVEKAEEWAQPVRLTATAGEVSYRGLYNLACFEAGAEEEIKVEGEGSAGRALDYLREALVEAPGNRAAELASWARKDPSLKPLQGTRGFEQLVDRFEPLRKVG